MRQVLSLILILLFIIIAADEMRSPGVTIATAEMRGPGNTTVSTNPTIQKIAYDVSGNPEYLGQAAPGSLTSQEKWCIQKITYDEDGNPTDIKFAEGETTFDKEWDERAGYDYE